MTRGVGTLAAVPDDVERVAGETQRKRNESKLCRVLRARLLRVIAARAKATTGVMTGFARLSPHIGSITTCLSDRQQRDP